MTRPWIWLLPCSVMGAIIWLSHQTTLPGGISLPHPLDKLAHAAAYAAVALTLDVAFRTSARGLPLYRRHAWVFVLVVLFGISDEWHQSFIPDREASGGDLLADALGAGLGLALACLPLLFSRHLGGLSWRTSERGRPDPARPLILVADAHWNEELTGLREATLRHPEADWLFLGDVFDVWVGLPGMETEAQRAFLWWVHERRHAGRWVGLCCGNREYFLDRHRGTFDALWEGTGGGLPAEGLAFEHGDLVNPADWKYRIWSLLSRSAPAWLLVRLLPGVLARRLAERLEQILRTTNPDYKLRFPREAFRQAARAADGKRFVTGHFHGHEEEGNGTVLPWARGAGFWTWREGRLEPLGA